MRIVLITLFVLFCHGSALAQSGGQIINVNQGFQIAFTDLGNATLKKDDVVKVFINGDEFVYMQVLESSSILSKLGPVQSELYKTNYKDLERISIGSTVTKIKLEETRASSVVIPDTQDAELSELVRELKDAKAQIARLTASNKELQTQLNSLPVKQPVKQNDKSAAVLSQVKTRLENMERIINQN
jgi:hypothetical protein